MGQENDDEAMAAYVTQASALDGQLLLLICIAIILGLGKGGVPGFATVATALTVATAPMNIAGGLGYAVSLQVPILAMIDISAAYLHSTSIDWYTTWLLLPISFVGMGLGQVLDRYMTDSLARILVGFILLSILLLKVWKDLVAAVTNMMSSGSSSNISRGRSSIGVGDGDGGNDLNYHDIESHNQSTVVINNENKRKHSPPPNSNRHQHQQQQSISKIEKYGWALVVGIFGGAATMLTNSMGPILNVYLLSVRKLSPTEYIGTRAMFFCFLNVGKIPMRFASGALGISMIPLACGLGLISVIGVFCAKPIMLSMKEETFVKLELVVVAFAGVRLMWLGLTM
jgi:uncharacterized membrane protein YfcA